MDHTEAARDSRREANAAIAQGIAKKLLTQGGRLTKDERHTAGQILSGIADLIANKPATEHEREYFWTGFDITLDVKVNYLLGEAWGGTKDGVL